MPDPIAVAVDMHRLKDRAKSTMRNDFPLDMKNE